MEIGKKEIGKALQKARKEAGFKSARIFAEYMNMAVTKYTEYEQGRCAFTYEQAWEFADALGCTMDELGGREWPQPAVADMPPDEQELVDCYRSVDGERKDRLLKNARDAALVAKKDEPGALPLPQSA